MSSDLRNAIEEAIFCLKKNDIPGAMMAMESANQMLDEDAA